MSANYGKNIELSIFGESHGKAIGINIGNLPAGIKLDSNELNKHMSRRAPGKNRMSTSRVEDDKVEFLSGVKDGYTTGAPLCAVIYNNNQHSKDYSELEEKMRPSHSDYPAFIKYKGYNDVRGGGHFSGRLTAPVVLAGSIARMILKEKGITIGAHIKSVKDINDDAFDVNIDASLLESLQNETLPVLNKEVASKYQQVIEDARMHSNSVGGQIECAITGIEPGIGNPFFDSVESHLSQLLFSIPAVKGVTFGNSDIYTLYGDQANDAYYYDHDHVKTKTNNNGGILGGITTGMPVVFTVNIKPTPSISIEQNTVNIKTHENTTLAIHGRHDPCIVQRAVVVVESMAAIALLDMLGDHA